MSVKNISEFLRCLRVLDGGFTTEMERIERIEVDNPGNDLWGAIVLLEQPETVIAVHKRFLDAGARVITSNTYRCCIRLLVEHHNKSELEAREIGRNAIRLTKRAIQEWKCERKSDEQVLLAGSVGPIAGVFYHDFLKGNTGHTEYAGCYVEDEGIEEKLFAYHYEQTEMVLWGGCDLVAFETVPALLEAKVILKVLEKFKSAKAWVTFTCKNSTSLSHGELFHDAMDLCLSHPQIVCAGINCTDPTLLSDLLRSAQDIRLKYNKPFIVYPNSGEIYSYTESWSGERTSPTTWTNYVSEWHSLGANIIGGCCRVYATDIAHNANICARIRKDDHITNHNLFC